MSIINILVDIHRNSNYQIPISLKEDINLIVFSGESNGGGQALNSAATPAELAPRSQLQILNNTTILFEDLDVGTNNLIGHTNMSTPTLRHGWELHLANRMITQNFTQPLYLVKTAQGGSRITNWAEGSLYSGVNPWQVFQDRVDAALLLITPLTTKFALFYSQGINDGLATIPAATWQPLTIAHFNKIRVKYGNVPIIMTKLMSTAPDYVTYNTAIEFICSTVPNCYFINTEDALKDDNYHWSYRGMKLLCDRMVNKLLENYNLN